MLTKKEAIIYYYASSINWIKNLENITETQWQTQISGTHLTVAQIITHFIPWDKFTLEERIPYFFTEIPIVDRPTSVDFIQQALNESQEQSKEDIIAAFSLGRQKLIDGIATLDDEAWLNPFTIGKSTFSLYAYFLALSQYDEHLLLQIEDTFSVLI